MDSWELANQEIATQRHEIIQESEKHLFLPKAEGPVIIKTHKGEVEIPQRVVAVVTDPVPAPPPARLPSSAAAAAGGDSQSDAPSGGESDLDEDTPLMHLRTPDAIAAVRPLTPVEQGAGRVTPQLPVPLVSGEWRAVIDPKTVPPTPTFEVTGKLVSGPAVHTLLPQRIDIIGRTQTDMLAKFVRQVAAGKSSKALAVLAVDAAADHRQEMIILRDFYAQRGRCATSTADHGTLTLHLVPTNTPDGAQLASELMPGHSAPLMGLLLYNPAAHRPAV